MRRLEPSDFYLLSAFTVAAALGTWSNVLLNNDGAYFLSVGWLGDAWDLYFSQFSGRALALLLSFGPAWFARWAFAPDVDHYLTLAHILYFLVPLGLWLSIRAIEASPIYSRLYLAAMLPLVYFPTEAIVGAGLWVLAMAAIARQSRSTGRTIFLAVGFAVPLAFTHPTTAAMSVLYLVIGGVAVLLGRPFPRATLLPVGVIAIILLGAYAATSRLLPATNPSILEMQAASSRDYVDLGWMAVTLMLFPMLAATWGMLLAPGLPSANPRWRVPRSGIVLVGLIGLWFAANGTSLYSYLFARYTVAYVLSVALALALARPASDWLAAAARPLRWCAAMSAVAACSYTLDIMLFGQFVDRHLVPGVVDVDQDRDSPWPRVVGRDLLDRRAIFKWTAGADYVRDVVMPDYERYRQVLAFVSFFRSNRQSILYHRLPPGNWVPFECPAVERAQIGAHDEADRRFLAFLGEYYCVR